MEYYENEGALFRGFSPHYPTEVYSFRQHKWLPYEGEVPKGQLWGEQITQKAAMAWIEEERNNPSFALE